MIVCLFVFFNLYQCVCEQRMSCKDAESYLVCTVEDDERGKGIEEGNHSVVLPFDSVFFLSSEVLGDVTHGAVLQKQILSENILFLNEMYFGALLSLCWEF